jgi:hypothetical protein
MRKIVYESLNEMNFERRKDPFGVLGIGKRQLIKDWLDEMDIVGYTINDDYTIDILRYGILIGSVNLKGKNLKKFPDYIQFNRVQGYFDCDDNELTSLRGCPTYIANDSYFGCEHNRLTSLQYCPLECGDFYCSGNTKVFTIEDVDRYCHNHRDLYF